MKIKEINWKKILLMSAWFVFGAGFLVLLSFVNTSQQALLCKSIEININDKVQHDFIEESDLMERINGNDKILGHPLGTINISLLEKKILSNPYVATAEVYSTIDGKLQINVVQRDPIVRIITMRDEQFYIDRNGKFMPVCDHYSLPVIVASGYIFDTYAEMQIPAWQGNSLQTDTTLPQQESIMNQIFSLSQYIDQDTFLNAQIEQIYVNAQQEIELIPRVGNHKIILGSTVDLEEKFHKLYIFYTRGLNKTGWNNYSTINLKYKNQVVCTKKNS